MKMNAIVKMAVTLCLSGIMAFSGNLSAWANTNAAAPTVARTRAWDAIEKTLGGVPERVLKIEYAGSVFYLGEGVTEDDFLAVLKTGPKAVKMHTSQEGVLYKYPVYILWNADKTALLVHPVIYDYDDVLETVAIPTTLTESGNMEQKSVTTVTAPAKTQKINVIPKEGLTAEQTVEYMLSTEYADAVRKEFYRILNEYRVANGLRELEINLELQEYADIRAAEQRIIFGHTRPDGSPAGSDWHDSKNNLNTRYAENAKGAATLNSDPITAAVNIFSRWKNSPGHNSHMLYKFSPQITMALGIVPEFDEHGFVSSGAIFATGY